MAKGKKRQSGGKVAAQRAEERQKLPLTRRRRERRDAGDLAPALQRERDMLDAIMETTSAQIAYLDTEFNFIKVNSAYAKGSGHTAEELIGKNHFALFPNPENQAIFEKVRDTGEPAQYIAKPFVYADQPERGVTYWDWTLSPVKDASGRVQGLVLSLVDVTEKTRAEEELRHSRQMLENITQGIAENILLLSKDLEILWANKAALEETGYEMAQVLGNRCYKVTHHRESPCEGSLDPCPIYDLQKTGKPVTVTHTHFDAQGEKIFVEVSAYPIRAKDGEIVQFIHVSRDVTERKRMEKALAESEEKYRDLHENAPIAYFSVGVDGCVRSCNRRAQELLGYSEEELTGKPVLDLYVDGPEGREKAKEVLRRFRNGEEIADEELEMCRPDGRPVHVNLSVTPIRDATGAVLASRSIVVDITERKRAQEELERLRTEFLGMVTHELKTPLTAIKGSAATALGSQRPFSPEENTELFQIVDEQADRLRELVDNLLDMTRIEAGSLSISAEPTDLRDVLEEARSTFARSGGSHQVELELPDDLPAVAADRHRVAQVLTNLLNNAARFSPTTAPISITAEHDTLHVTIHVRDRGRGIPREKLPLLFKKFSQVHDDAGQKLSGTGLGLAICKGIVEAHGGRIWADSAGEGQGSTFSLTLPVAAETSVKSLLEEASRAAHLGRVRRPGERARVLAVDDEPQVLRYLQRSLDEAGYQPIVTSDPSEVPRLVELEEPDLVLLDLRLPGISGFDLLQRIREFSGVPVIFLTASDREEDAVRALRMGADDYITKPFSPSELLARIGAALRRRLLPDLMEARPPFVLGDLTINFAERRVTVGGQEVSLSATEYKILYELATHAGRVLTYDHILQRVWGEEYSGETELVRSFIRNLRRKLGDDAHHPRFIFTERQAGYRMPKP